MQGSEACVTAFLWGCIQNIDVDEIIIDGKANKDIFNRVPYHFHRVAGLHGFPRVP